MDGASPVRNLAATGPGFTASCATPILLDPLIGLGMTVVILCITRGSWRTVRGHPHHH